MTITLCSRAFTSDATTLRDRVSHSWLDHLILGVSPNQSVKLYESNEWDSRINSLYPYYFEEARRFAKEIMRLSPSAIVENLPLFQNNDDGIVKELKTRLDKNFIEQIQYAKTLKAYENELVNFERVIIKFSEFIRHENLEREQIKEEWRLVLRAAQSLKKVFDENIPRGILLP